MESIDIFQSHRKIRLIRHKLLMELGASYARIIDREMKSIEELYSQGVSYEEIVQYLKSRQMGVSSNRSLSTSISHEPSLPSRQKSRHLTPIRNRSGIDQDYRSSRYLTNLKGTLPQGIQYYAKLDELKALEAQRMGAAFEKKKEAEKKTQRRKEMNELRMALDQQVQDKLKHNAEIRIMEKKYRKAIDERIHRIYGQSGNDSYGRHSPYLQGFMR